MTSRNRPRCPSCGGAMDSLCMGDLDGYYGDGGVDGLGCDIEYRCDRCGRLWFGWGQEDDQVIVGEVLPTYRTSKSRTKKA